MLGSLRVRLPLVFLAGIVLAGVITTLIAVRLFQSFAHDQALTGLKREAHGIAGLYSDAIHASYGTTRKSTDRCRRQFAAKNLERRRATRSTSSGPKRPFPGQIIGLQRLPLKTIDWSSGKSLSFEFTPARRAPDVPGGREPDLSRQDQPVGAIVVATPKTDVSHRVYAPDRRLALAGLVGLLVAAMLAVVPVAANRPSGAAALRRRR